MEDKCAEDCSTSTKLYNKDATDITSIKNWLMHEMLIAFFMALILYTDQI